MLRTQQALRNARVGNTVFGAASARFHNGTSKRSGASVQASARTHKFNESYLQPCAANCEQLTPLSFLQRSAELFGSHPAVVYDAADVRLTYSELQSRCSRLASALQQRLSIVPGDVVSVMAYNTPPMLEAHYGVPGSGAVLHTINTRLDAAGVAFQLEHAESRALLCDVEFVAVAREALQLMDPKHRPILIHIQDSSHHSSSGSSGGHYGSNAKVAPAAVASYEELLADGDATFQLQRPVSEHDAISLCYTSGTTGSPKGVVTHHRGAFLNSVASAQSWALPPRPVFLWIVPMFHCNGWCFPWTVAARGGVSVCQRHVRADSLLHAMATEGVTHMAGAPVVMNMLLHAEPAAKAPVKALTAEGKRFQMITGGAPPPPSLLRSLKSDLGIEVMASYGLTETYGPAAAAAWDPSWDGASQIDRDGKLIWQARSLCCAGAAVAATASLNKMSSESSSSSTTTAAEILTVPADGTTVGELVLRGNTVMKGYLKNERATLEAFAGGWFRTGDLAVAHPNGRFEIKDRSKDVIISGGENILSVEVEAALHSHAAVSGVACVAVADDYWGECVCAVVELTAAAAASIASSNSSSSSSSSMNNDSSTSSSEKMLAAELIAHTKQFVAHYKAPRVVLFRPIIRTSTGKVQKHELRKVLAAEGIKGPGKK
jgi:fatty-acyl-CoA synthase